MACLTLLFIVILTIVSKVTSLHCSDQQLPASGDDDLQQVTTLQYCLVDDCTIMKIDTGEKLDIVYTTDSLIVTTPTDGHTSEVIARLENELPCPNPDGIIDDYQVQDILQVVEFSMILAVSGYIIAVHVMFKELQNLIGKLFILYNISVIGIYITNIGIILTPLQPLIDLLAFCYVSTISLIISVVSTEALITCILSHIATTMHRTYKLQPQLTKEASRYHFRFYVTYTLGVTLLTLFLTICFDIATHNYKDILLPNGQCVSLDVEAYGTFQIPIIVIGIHKIVKVVRFITYLYYLYKVNKDISDAGRSNYLHKLAVAMGAFIGLGYFTYMLAAISDISVTVLVPLSAAIFLMQQCVVVAIFMCSQKTCRLYGECVSKE